MYADPKPLFWLRWHGLNRYRTYLDGMNRGVPQETFSIKARSGD